jgi:cystathionine beta-lyase/cystathionine gamma-synthase
MTRRLSTICARAGAATSPPSTAAALHSHAPPLYQGSVFDFPSIEASLPALAGDGFVYRRLSSPNGAELEAAVAALEGGEGALATSSGMAAIAAALYGLTAAGDRVVAQRDAYGGTRAFFDGDLRRQGIEVTYADAYDPDALEVAVTGARVALIETVANPLLRETPLEEIAERCRRRGALLVVDNTFATPVRDRPLERGADLVVHSATKFLGGHHDLLAGVVVGSGDLLLAARGAAARMGLTVAPFDAWLAVRGIRTLEVRMRRAWETAAELARRLAQHPAVARVHHADRCALVSFDVGDFDAANQVVAAATCLPLSPSLGGVTSTFAHPATSSHRALSPEERRSTGIGDGLLRLSVGLEDVEDLWDDLARALDSAASRG